MIRSPAAFRAIFIKSAVAGGLALLVVAAVAAAQPGAALALPGAVPAAALERTAEAGAGLPVIRTAGCRDGGSPCLDDGPPPYEPPRGRVSRWEPAPERHGGPYEPAVQEEPCLEDRRPSRNYVYHAPAPPPLRGYEGYEERWCGVRCWYRRLREGYCGRGCDYYRFRLTEFPEGKLSNYRRRYACKTAH
ncbi:MAG TPA: hypothetical protein VH858_15755 [Hyphomicrobiales bacterium]